jgi:hypothetical protein
MRFIAIGAAFGLAACSTLDHIHSPQFGLLSSDQIPNLIKSVRCELVTFYAANAARKNELDAIRNYYRQRGLKTISLDRVLEHRYFDLDTDAYGTFVLEAKVQDTAGTLSSGSSSLANVVHSPTGHIQTLTIGPNISSQGTYDMFYNFAIQQDDMPSDIAAIITEDQLPNYVDGDHDEHDASSCYRAVVSGRFDQLARGQYPQLERFSRVTVNGGLPLAAWLQENTTTMGVSRNILADSNPPKDKHGQPTESIPVLMKYQKEAIDGGQMSFIFTVQYTVGVDAKFSLVTAHWNPLAPDLSAAVIQTGGLSIYINGFMTQAALGAKSGVVGIAGRAVPAPQQVVVVNGTAVKGKYPPANYPPVITAPEGSGGPGGENNSQEVKPTIPGARTGPNRGIFLAPATPFILTPGL